VSVISKKRKIIAVLLLAINAGMLWLTLLEKEKYFFQKIV